MVLRVGFMYGLGDCEDRYEYTWSPLLRYSYYRDEKNKRVVTVHRPEEISIEDWGLLMDESDKEWFKVAVTPLG